MEYTTKDKGVFKGGRGSGGLKNKIGGGGGGWGLIVYYSSSSSLLSIRLVLPLAVLLI